MSGYLSRRLLAVLLALTLTATASAGEVLSTMRNVNAVAEAHGFRLNMVHDVQTPQLSSDLSPPQVFEILRPDGKAVTIGRLFTSCSCIQLESPKRTFGADERAVLTLRNIKPTPPAGQVYAIFVQITSPVRTTLRFDTYVQSGMAGGMPFENASSPTTDTAPIGSGALATGTTTTARPAGYQGSAHADAVAALTRQIDQGFAKSSAPSSSVKEEEDELTAEARETALAEKTPTDKESAEADEQPEPLPPPAELSARTAAAGAATAATANVEAEPAQDQYADANELEEDEDDYNPLLADPAVQLTARPRINSSATRQQEGALLRTLSSEELERELQNDAEELYAREKAGAVVDQRNLAKSAKDDEEDLGTANLIQFQDYYAQQEAGQQPVQQEQQVVQQIVMQPVTPSATQQQAVQVQRQTIVGQQVVGAGTPSGILPGSMVEDIHPNGVEEAYIASNAGQGEFRAEQQLRAAGDNLPPPPGLSTPNNFDDSALVASSGGMLQSYEEEGEVVYAPPGQAMVQTQPIPAYATVPGDDVVRPEPRPDYSTFSRKPVQAVSLITIGVRDMPASIRFYEALGWRRAAQGKYDQTAFFQLQGQILALYPMNDLLREQNMPGSTPVPGGMTLALHVLERSDVWAVYQRFIDAGGKTLRAPAEMASGAVTSYVADPDGNAWEISWVPQFRIDEDGGLWLP